MDQIKNLEFREKLGMAPLSAKMHENRVRWFGLVLRCLVDYLCQLHFIHILSLLFSWIMLEFDTTMLVLFRILRLVRCFVILLHFRYNSSNQAQIKHFWRIRCPTNFGSSREQGLDELSQENKPKREPKQPILSHSTKMARAKLARATLHLHLRSEPEQSPPEGRSTSSSGLARVE